MSILSILNSKPIQHTSIFFGIPVKESVFQLPKHRGSQQAIASGLVAGSHPLYFKQLGDFVQPAVQAIAELHQMLDIINRREIQTDQSKEASLRIRQILAR